METGSHDTQMFLCLTTVFLLYDFSMHFPNFISVTKIAGQQLVCCLKALLFVSDPRDTPWVSSLRSRRWDIGTWFSWTEDPIHLGKKRNKIVCQKVLSTEILVHKYKGPKTWYLFKMIQGTYNLIKIGSVTAEIYLIWTNVAKTNVAWTNVSLKIEICSRCSQEPTFKVSSKLGQ